VPRDLILFRTAIIFFTTYTHLIRKGDKQNSDRLLQLVYKIKLAHRLLFTVSDLQFFKDFAEIAIRIACNRDFESFEKSIRILTAEHMTIQDGMAFECKRMEKRICKYSGEFVNIDNFLLFFLFIIRLGNP
jgi:hypothetical protein